jgi:hypothetical protein
MTGLGLRVGLGQPSLSRWPGEVDPRLGEFHKTRGITVVSQRVIDELQAYSYVRSMRVPVALSPIALRWIKVRARHIS